MSVLIKGMKMPDNCGECKFLCSENFKSWCHVTDRDDIFIDVLPDWCPLVELPEHHGRLVDQEDISKMIRNPYEWKEVMRWVDNAQTIIEAEGDE